MLRTACPGLAMRPERRPGRGAAERRRTAPAPLSVHLTALKSYLHALHCAHATLSRLCSETFTIAARSGAANVKGVFVLRCRDRAIPGGIYGFF